MYSPLTKFTDHYSGRGFFFRNFILLKLSESVHAIALRKVPIGEIISNLLSVLVWKENSN